MAKLLSYYRLCPLIDTKNLLGISEDVERGAVIVTLGRNIAIKYRLSDQKQLCSWRSKEKFSSPVYHDGKLEKYVAVFNHTFIRIWTEEEETLDKVKKYKFNQPIHTILTHNKHVFVVFKTGSVYPLNEILESRKTFTAATVIEGVEIHDILYTSLDEDLYFGILVKHEDGFIFHWTIHTYYSKNVFSKSKLQIEDLSLKSCMLFADNKKVHLLTVWSDGRMFTLELMKNDKEQSDVGELFAVLENISAAHLIKSVPLDYKHIAIYGSDPNEEGAVLLIYNTQFKVTQSKQIHKLYSEDANIWRTYNFILLPVGQNLTVVPFCLESEKLATLIASHKPVPAKTDSDVIFVTEFEIAHWSSGDSDSENISKKTKKKNKKAKTESKKGKQMASDLKIRFEELLRQGLPEATIIEQIIPEVLEENNINLLEHILSFFSDIPEKTLSKILHFTLSCDSSNFANNCDVPSKNLPEKLLPIGRVTLLDKVLVRDFSDTLLLPYLRTELSVDEAAHLLQYFVYQLSEDGHNLPSLNALRTERCIINWTSVIIDSNYQKFILSKDTEIEDVLVKCKDAVAEYFDVLEDLKSVVPVLAKFEAEAKGKSFVAGRVANGLYSIEQIYY